MARGDNRSVSAGDNDETMIRFSWHGKRGDCRREVPGLAVSVVFGGLRCPILENKDRPGLE